MNYHNITYPDILNGDGLRVVLWLSGCSHHCNGCQNPQTWDVNNGIPFDEIAEEELFRELDKDYISGLTLTGGDPLHEVNLGKVLDIVTKFRKRYPLPQDVENSPQHIVDHNKENHNILNEEGNKIRVLYPDKTIWLYTGYSVEYCNFLKTLTVTEREDINVNIRRELILSKCDIVVDGRYIDSLRDVNLHWKGSSNQRVIDAKKSLQKGEVVLWDTN